MRNEDVVRIENPAARPDRLDIRWHVTSQCNYACDFCIQGDREAHRRDAAGESAATRAAVCEALLERIGSLRGYKSVHVGLIGGEVTILPDFPELLERFASCGFRGDLSLQITTNLSLPAERYAALCRSVRRCDRPGMRRYLFPAASFDRAYVSQEAFTEKLRAIARSAPAKRRLFSRAAPSVQLRAGFPILTDDDYDAYLRMADELAPCGVRTDPIPIRRYRTELSDAVREKLAAERSGGAGIRVLDGAGVLHGFPSIQALGQALEGAEHFCPRGFRCDAGVHSLWVDAFGSAWRCPVLGDRLALGSVLDGSLRLLEDSALGTADHCSCSQFHLIERA
ncbi:MAG: radical SAM protein [Oscillospiraceae bacterium]|nr:radical SAM protein [Oscillospiraceae bacterium]